MWKIKDPALKDKINQLVVSDDRIATCCREQMKDPTDYILLESEVFKLSMRVDKDYFEEVPEYNPYDWNPYPTVTPPVDRKKWLTQDEDGNLDIRSFSRTFEEGIDYSWENQDDRLIVAFRSLPPLYTRDEQIDN